MKFCESCGKEVNEEAVVCVNCGASIKSKSGSGNLEKSSIIIGLLQILLPIGGVGRFLIGDTTTGVLQLILSFFAIGKLWSLIDGIMIIAKKEAKVNGEIVTLD